MIRIAHISDLHFGREISFRMEGLIKTIETFQPDLTVVTGDLTQRATIRQYRAARDFLNRIPQPKLVIPGNHDLPIHRLFQRFLDPWKRWCQFISSEIEPWIHTEEYNCIGLNTVHPMGVALDWSRGRLKDLQISVTVEKLKRGSKDTLRIIGAHHPFWLPEQEKHRHLVDDSQKAFHAFQSAGVDIILGGHIHTAYAHLEKGVIICHAGSSASNRLRKNQKNSFNFITGDRKQLKIEKIVWQDKEFRAMPTTTASQFVHKHGIWQKHTVCPHQ